MNDTVPDCEKSTPSNASPNYIENNDDKNLERAGAQACDDESFGDEPSSELPMVVWLRGDEPHCSEFSMDAEAAMEALGIKRSRLTQISGRELRVGRMRIDRYVRPVYRPCDIEQYLGWTRATATHQRASNIIDDAAVKLEQRALNIESKLQQTVERLNTSVSQLVREIASETEQLQIAGQKKIADELVRCMIKIEDQIQGLAGALVTSLEELRESNNQLTLEDLDVALAKHHEPIAESQQSLKSLVEYTSDLAKLLSPLEQFREHLTSDLEEIAPALSEIYTLLFDSAAQTKESLENQARFNRGIAEALSKVIECQREATLKQQAMLIELVAAQTKRGKTKRLMRQPQRGHRLMICRRQK